MAIPCLGLLPGDRLEPGRDMHDVADFNEHMVTPDTIVFWHRSNESMTRNRNQLLEKR